MFICGCTHCRATAELNTIAQSELYVMTATLFICGCIHCRATAELNTIAQSELYIMTILPCSYVVAPTVEQLQSSTPYFTLSQLLILHFCAQNKLYIMNAHIYTHVHTTHRVTSLPNGILYIVFFLQCISTLMWYTSTHCLYQ